MCGGTRTELDYFDGLRRSRRNSAVRVTVIAKGVAPDQLVRHAKRIGSDYDEMWCVVDADEFDIAKAARLADELGVRLVVSNPCFELWLLLHFTDHRGVCSSYKQLLPKLIKHVPGYDKSRVDFAQYKPGVAVAVERAERLDPSGRDHGRNPSTGVWKLVRQVLPG
ncbi:RloB family protein [Kutzneria sp. CA-103260]|uniref:RloB family protein n=1 Tax=Kutzneria sp. CA-103260 TaxID=2802641 RepID=UPI00201324C2|nr:RloB family protein [Kutzneria sp. CA-103260]